MPAIPRFDYRVLLASATQGLSVYDHMRGLAIHARAINPVLPTEERGWGRLLRRETNGSWSERRSYTITAAGVQDGSSPAAGSASLWIASGMMAFSDVAYAENASAHAASLALQGAQALSRTVIEAMTRQDGKRFSTGMVHQCEHEEGGPCVVTSQWRFDPPGAGATVWAPGQVVQVGDVREYEGISYVCLQGHTTQEGWHPPAVPALWGVA